MNSKIWISLANASNSLFIALPQSEMVLKKENKTNTMGFRKTCQHFGVTPFYYSRKINKRRTIVADRETIVCVGGGGGGGGVGQFFFKNPSDI